MARIFILKSLSRFIELIPLTGKREKPLDPLVSLREYEVIRGTMTKRKAAMHKTANTNRAPGKVGMGFDFDKAVAERLRSYSDSTGVPMSRFAMEAVIKLLDEKDREAEALRQLREGKKE